MVSLDPGGDVSGRTLLAIAAAGVLCLTVGTSVIFAGHPLLGLALLVVGAGLFIAIVVLLRNPSR